MPTDRRDSLRPAQLARSQVGGVRVATLRRDLRALGSDRFTTESVVAVSVSWVADVLSDIAFTVQDPHLAEALLGEAQAVLTSARPVRPRTREATVREIRPVVGEPRVARPVAPLTRCEVVLLRRLEGEQSLREIGADLHVSVNTVKTHVRSIYRKFNVNSRRDAVSRARVLRLL